MTWLITGGAGYVGAHVLRSLRAEGVPVVVLDDLTTGLACRVPPDVPLVTGSVSDRALLRQLMIDHSVEGVVHLAAKKQVAESVADPLLYYRENVGGCEAVLQAMAEAGARRLVFSSSAAVYGTPTTALVTEGAPTDPISPYGRTKLVCEQMISAVSASGALDAVSLRYFNVAGAGEPALAEHGASNLIPRIFEGLERGVMPSIFGADYPTDDGTCVRDFIHVVDLADAHVAAVRELRRGHRANHQVIYNVGRGHGSSVRQVIDMVASVTGRSITARVTARRRGDPPVVVADCSRIRQELGWAARRDLRAMVTSDWEARRARRQQTRS